MEPLLLIPIVLSFFITFLVLPGWIKRARKAGLEGKDINKYENPKVTEGGGVVVVTGFLIGILFYIALRTFYFKSTENLIEIFSLISSIMIVAFMGMMDDVLGWKIGLGKKLRLFLVFIAAVPLMVINAGSSGVNIPLIDGINLGLIYPLIIIPIGIIGASTTFNFLAGYNGLEAGQGFLMLGALSVVAYFTGNPWLSLIGLCILASLAAFLIFNKHPAKVLPGNVLTFPLGALIAIFAILGNFEKIAIFFFIPYIIETCLKLRAGVRMDKESFGKPQKDNSLELPYEKIYGLEHFSIWFLKKIGRKKVYEKNVVYFIHFIQIIIIILGFILFRQSIF